MKNSEKKKPVQSNHEDVWAREYSSLLNKWKETESLNVLAEEDERRDFPRFKLKTDTISVRLEARFPVINLSRAGLCFHSKYAINEGQKIRLILEKTFLMEVEIIGCEQEPDAEWRENFPHRLHGRFTNPNHGMQMLVMLDEMDNLEVDIDQNTEYP